MAKKVQKAKKAAEPEPIPTPSKITKSAKKASPAQQLTLFSDNFYSKIADFKQLYIDVNVNITGSTKGQALNLDERFQNISESLEKNCSKVLEAHLTEAQKWISSQVEETKARLDVLENHYTNVQDILKKSEELDEDEIGVSLTGLKSKIQNKKAALSKFEDLLARSKSVYA